jgi:hypothetical protein
MAMDIRVLGKLLALSHSPAPAEAAEARKRFDILLEKWTREAGLPEDAGYVTLEEPTEYAVALAEILGAVVDTKILALAPFELIAVAREPAARWLWWWFRNTHDPIEKAASRANYKERHLYAKGAFEGIKSELASYVGVRELPRRAVNESQIKPPPDAAPVTPAERAEPPKPMVLNARQNSVARDGINFGRKLARQLLSQRPPPPPTARTP